MRAGLPRRQMGGERRDRLGAAIDQGQRLSGLCLRRQDGQGAGHIVAGFGPDGVPFHLTDAAQGGDERVQLLAGIDLVGGRRGLS